MSRVQMSKSFLQKERAQLALYRRVLPSLDLKRRQLLLQLESERRALSAKRDALATLLEQVERELPMVASTDLPVSRLLEVAAIEYGQESVVGIKLRTLERLTLHRVPYGLLTKPAWVDVLVMQLERATQHRVELAIHTQRLAIVDKAAKRMTQRVNLFEKILIPNTQDNIRRAQIMLGDQERAAVVRAKIAKTRDVTHSI